VLYAFISKIAYFSFLNFKGDSQHFSVYQHLQNRPGRTPPNTPYACANAFAMLKSAMPVSDEESLNATKQPTDAWS
jgi:hypothetical protein